MSDQPKSSSKGWMVLVVVALIAAFVFFVPIKHETFYSARSSERVAVTLWEMITRPGDGAISRATTDPVGSANVIFFVGLAAACCLLVVLIRVQKSQKQQNR